MALMVPGSRMPMDRDDNAENADQAAAPPVDESLEPTDTGEDLDAKADTPQDIEEGAARQPFSPIGSRHRTTSQLAVKPPNGLRGRVSSAPKCSAIARNGRPRRRISAAWAAMRWNIGMVGGSRSSTSSGTAARVRNLCERVAVQIELGPETRRSARWVPGGEGAPSKIRGSPDQPPQHRSMMIAKSLSAMPVHPHERWLSGQDSCGWTPSQSESSACSPPGTPRCRWMH